MKKSLFVALAAALLFNGSLMAVPAKQGVRVFTQPDGSDIELRKIGDERAHITVSPEGYPITLSPDGFYHFAEIGAKGELIATQIKVRPVSSLSAAERATVEAVDLSKINLVLKERYEASPMVSAQNVVASRAGGIGLMDDSLLGRETLKGLVILAEYKDVKFSATGTREFFETMLNEQGFSQYDATGSARDYFIEASFGKFTPTFDVYGPVTLPNDMAYYGGNIRGSDKNAVQMIYDACKGLDDQIDFAEYDQDGDGYVDNVFVFYAGYGEASYGTDDSVWPHQWSLSSGGLSLTLDGVRINKYACSNELIKDNKRNPKPDGIGTFVHEFSHVLGLPDLYVTSGGGGNWTPMAWSILDQGPYNNDSRTPPTYSAFERYALGWIEPTVINGAHSLILNPILNTNEAFIIPTEDENEFFLLENRQQTGWDSYIPGHGMLVWHIDYDPTKWMRNAVNNDRYHNCVDIEEARGTWADPNSFRSYKEYLQALADYAFPGSKGVTSFTDTTTPSMTTWENVGLGLPITDIIEDDGIISFNVAGGHCDAEVPIVTEPKLFGENWFEATWCPSDGAVDYLLTVMYEIGEGPKTDIANFDVDELGKGRLPESWSYILTDGTLCTDGSYGEASPSLKLSKSGSGLITGNYEDDVTDLEFWLRGRFTTSSATLLVEYLADGEWKTLSTIAPPRDKGKLYIFTDLPAGIHCIRFIYENDSNIGYFALDDVKVTYNGGGFVTLPDYRLRSVGAVTSHRVENLPEGVNSFVYTVYAVDHNGRRSAPSNEQIVNLDSNAGIDDVVVDGADAPVRYYNLQGVEIACPSSGIVIRRHGDRSEKIIITQ